MKKVLIIEDEQIITNIYRNKLTVEGYQVETAPDGETGLELVRTFHPDAIVLDLMLPKMSGVEVIKQIRSESEFSKLPIIVFSNIYLNNMIQDAWRAGATKCLSKTGCSPREFIDMVRQTVGDSGAVPRTGSGDTKFRQKSKPETLAGFRISNRPAKIVH
jgi:DNA-binding response OmpR family regulator